MWRVCVREWVVCESVCVRECLSEGGCVRVSERVGVCVRECVWCV